ncbi:MAG: LysM peptidoglycan-binding domain-containing protein [Chthoniobacterales bacterium]
MRAPFFCVFLIGFTASISQLSAQTPVDGDADLKRQVGALREAVIQQTRQIDALTAEIERLGIALGQRRPPKTSEAVTPAPAAPTLATSEPPATATPSASAPVVATPTPDPNVLQHTVIKGDNLTNIAKKYGTTADAIQKLNKITDARKMQIGQVLSIPTPPPAAAAPSPAAH